jgi:hypothetical protein
MDGEFMVFIPDPFYDLRAGMGSELFNDSFKLFQFGEFIASHK